MSESAFRSIQVVIQQLLVVIPKTETALIGEIKEYRNTLWNRAPEMMESAELWIPVQHILARNILFLDKDWKILVQKIFVGKN